jgi:hypothetical protein
MISFFTLKVPDFLKTGFILLQLLLFFFTGSIRAEERKRFAKNQPDSAEISVARLSGLVIGGSVAYMGSMGALYFAWYKNHPQTSFHFHDDLHDWLQMDKGGHLVSSYWMGLVGYEALRWSGVDKKAAIWYGGSIGSVYLATIEFFDGFSEEWGFSVSDFAANTLGSAMFISQQLIWDEQKVLLKYSYFPTKFAGYRPGTLGSNHIERMLKDYNGITYWVSVNLNAIGFSYLPPWLNIAAGYSATGLTGGSENIRGWHKGSYIPEYERTRQFLLSLDIDLTRIETRSHAMNLFLKTIGFIKIPFPAIGLDSNKKIGFHPLYF